MWFSFGIWRKCAFSWNTHTNKYWICHCILGICLDLRMLNKIHSHPYTSMANTFTHLFRIGSNVQNHFRERTMANHKPKMVEFCTFCLFDTWAHTNLTLKHIYTHTSMYIYIHSNPCATTRSRIHETDTMDTWKSYAHQNITYKLLYTVCIMAFMH